MKNSVVSVLAFVSFLGFTADAQVGSKALSPSTQTAIVPAAQAKQLSVSLGAPPAASQGGKKVSVAQTPLSFEPNVGQSEPAARFTARTPGYSLQLEATRAQLRFGQAKAGADGKAAPDQKAIAMEMVGANPAPEVRGEEQLLGKDNYFPTRDPKTWFSNIPTYWRVKYSAVYPGVDAAFYGNANRLEYDFMLQPKADAGQIRMKLTGADAASIDKDGSLVLRIGKDDIRFLVPVAYQPSSDGKHRDSVSASYNLESAANGEPAMVGFTLGTYDRARPLVIDPVLALTYAEYLNGYVGDVTVDGSGNTYVTGQNTSGTGFYVTEYNSVGTVVYNASIGAGGLYPVRVRVDSTGKAYVAGYAYSSATLPTGSNSYKSTVTASTNGFLVQIAAGGGSVPYATFIGGTDTSSSGAFGLGVETISGVTFAFLDGYTYSSTFPVTAGVYQGAFSGSPGGNYDGWVAKFNPAASGAASLDYSTYLSSTDTQFNALAVDASGDAYVTGAADSTGFPVTSGAFQYDGYYSGNGGVYVTELNPVGTALVYSAYLGYGVGYGIAVDGGGNAYVTGTVGYEDFPTTAGAYQTSYPGGFVTKLNAGGATEAYSTFLGGPSSVSGNDVLPSSISLANGCSSACDAYVSGFTSTLDFPAFDAIQTTASTSGNSSFIAELNATGSAALFSSYLSGLTGYIYDGAAYTYGPSGSFGWTPAIAADSSGNMSVVGDLYGTADFPVTINSSNSDYAFLAKISPTATEPFTWSTPTSVSFGSQTVGVSTSVYPGPQTVNVRNLSDTAVTISSITASPASIFSASDSCAGTIPAAGACTLSLNFDPGGPGVVTGTVTVNSNASDSPLVIALTGTGADGAFTEASATSLTFGPQNVSTTSAQQLVTLTNSGTETAALSIYYPYLGTDFYAEDNCSSQLVPGASCVASVTFTPTRAGLRTATLYVQGGGGPTISIPLSGTGLAAGATGTVNFSSPALQFGSQTVGTTTAAPGQLVYINNTGSVPVTVSAITASGDFSIYSNGCGAVPFQLAVQSSCYVYTTFTPSAVGSRTGFLTFTDSASGSPQSVALSGTGVAGAQTLEFYPSPTVDFGSDVPVGVESGTITVYAQNAGTSPITINRTMVSGDFLVTYDGCSGTTLAGTTQDGTGSLSYCRVNVNFLPTATGLRTGTLTFIDSAGNSPQTVALSGNAIADTGTAAVTPTQLDFSTQAVGTTSATQSVLITNPGDTVITVNSYKTGTGNFSTADWYCGTVPFTLNPGASCGVHVQFTPTSAAALTDSLTIAGSIGTAKVSLSGTGVAESKTIGFTPASPMNSGSVVKGQSSGANGSSGSEAGDLVSIRNTGTAAVTFSASPAIGGTNAADFSLSNPYRCGNNATTLAPGASCPMWITFTPSVAAAETATLTFTDDATGTTQVLTLNGTGIAAAPKSYLSNDLLNFDNQVVGTTSPTNTYLYFYNNSGASVTLGNAVLSAGFLTPTGDQNCNGQVIANGSSCYVYVSFAPTSAGLITGTITFKNSGGTVLASAPLTGYAAAAVLSGLLTPSTLNFLPSQVVTSTSSDLTTVFTNTGNLPLTIGTVTGTNLGAAPTNEFKLDSDGCSGQPVPAGGSCTEYVNFTPNAAGARTGSLKIPVTYTGGTTASFTANFSGTGVAEVNSAVLQPGNGNFVDQTVGVQSPYTVLIYLVNQGNLPFKVGTLTGTNAAVGVTTTGEFSAQSAQGGSDGCSGQTLPANTGSCAMYFTFTPSANGARTGSVNFPVTFADNTTKTVTATLTGKGVPAAPALQFSPAGLEFAPEIVGNTSAETAIAVKNIGNTTVHFSAVATPSAGFTFGPDGDGCFALSLNNLPVNQTCYIYVSFAPTATGNITGTLTVHDNATGGPHTFSLSGTAIAANQQIAISQTALTFGNQPQGSTSSPQLVYVTNQSDTTVTSLGAILGGTNAADYQVTNNCPSALGARAVCSLTVVFSPATTATGTRTGKITLSDSDTGSPRTITLTGTAIVAGPAVALTPPSPLTFPTQNVGTTSGAENFSVTNTGTQNLTITGVALGGTNASEFSIASDGCSGGMLTPNQNCIVGIRFSPILGGTRTAIASVTDNATGSPQTIAITGLGYGIPVGKLSTTLLGFNDTLVGQVTPAQTVTLSNTGTDTLKIASIAITGGEGKDFSTPVTTCGATLAPAATCTLSTTFAPLYTGDKDAFMTVTDNTNNVAGSTQNVGLAAVAVGDPTTTTLVTSAGTTTSGQSVTFTATVTPSVGVPPGGTVTFMDGATALGNGTLAIGASSSVATFTTTTLTVGNHAIIAIYNTGTKDAGSSSSPLVQVVNPSPTATALKSSVNPSTSGESVTFTATVTATTGATPTGTVTFTSGTTTLGTGTLAGGVATFATTALPVGSSSITASYGGSSTDVASTSSALTQVVNVSPTATALKSSANPSTSGESVTFTATVTATTGATPTGTVTFTNGTTTLGTGTLAGGVATFATTALPVGSSSITASYGGSSTDVASTSSALTQVVNVSPTATALKSSANPSTSGESVTFTATVTATTGATPTGTVTFKNGTTTLGTGTLAGGVATFLTTTLPTGSDSITAGYGGSTTDATSTSAALDQVVNP